MNTPGSNYNTISGAAPNSGANMYYANLDASKYNNNHNYVKDNNNYDIENQQVFNKNEASLRLHMGFIRKVYGILTAQLLITVLMASLTFLPSVKLFCLQNMWLFWTCLILSICVIIPLLCFPKLAKTVPTNYILLAIWTFCEAYLVSVCCSTYEPKIVLSAAALTCAVTIALTIYAFTTETDFTFMGGMLYVSLCLLLGFGILSIFVPALKLLYCVAGVLLYSIYLIYDTQLIIGKFEKIEYDIDDYIIAAINIYLDVLNIFLYLLQILGGNR